MFLPNLLQPSLSWHLLFFLSACGMNVHHKCQTKVANLCGVNQKLMAEALAMIESTQQVSSSSILRCSSQKQRPRSWLLWVTLKKEQCCSWARDMTFGSKVCCFLCPRLAASVTVNRSPGMDLWKSASLFLWRMWHHFRPCQHLQQEKKVIPPGDTGRQLCCCLVGTWLVGGDTSREFII